MSGRELKYFKRKQKLKPRIQWGYTIKSYAFDGSKTRSVELDEAGVFGSFGMLIPRKLIKLPTKKQIKEKLYGRNSRRWKQRLAISPVTCFNKFTTYKSFMDKMFPRRNWTIIDNRTDKPLLTHGTK